MLPAPETLSGESVDSGWLRHLSVLVDSGYYTDNKVAITYSSVLDLDCEFISEYHSDKFDTVLT